MPNQDEPREIRAALIVLGRTLEARQGAFGARKKSDDDAAAASIQWLKKQICPHKAELLEKSKSTEADLGLAIAEIVLYALGNPVPGLPIVAKSIAQIGLERFCASPQDIYTAGRDEHE